MWASLFEVGVASGTELGVHSCSCEFIPRRAVHSFDHRTSTGVVVAGISFSSSVELEDRGCGLSEVLLDVLHAVGLFAAVRQFS